MSVERREQQRINEAAYRARWRDDPQWQARKKAGDKLWRASNREKVAGFNKRRTNAWRVRKPWMFSFRAARRRAKRCGMVFAITKQWCEKQWLIGHSQLSGLAFTDVPGSPFYPSIDRLDSSKGYTEDNCRLILFAENLFKNEWDDSVVVLIASAIANNARL